AVDGEAAERHGGAEPHIDLFVDDRTARARDEGDAALPEDANGAPGAGARYGEGRGRVGVEEIDGVLKVAGIDAVYGGAGGASVIRSGDDERQGDAPGREYSCEMTNVLSATGQ